MPSESRYHTLLAISLCLFVSVSLANAQYSGGTGSPDDPYQIANAADLIALGQTPDDYDKHFILTADIDLSGFVYPRALIAPDTNDAEWGQQGTPFAGVFDGNDHVIANLNVASSDADYVGLFGCVSDPNAEIRNLGLIDPNVTGGSGDSIGSMVGYLVAGTLRSCFVKAGHVSGCGEVGGLAGGAADGTITDCYATTKVSGLYDVGGLLGSNTANLRNCYATGEVIGGWRSSGGLVGYNSRLRRKGRGTVTVVRESGTITSCHASGNVSGGKAVGGLVGQMYSGAGRDCFATGSVTGNDRIGGLTGFSDGDIDNCYATGYVVGNEYVGGLVGENQRMIRNCYAAATVVGSQCVGGLVGTTSGGIIDSYASGAVSGQLGVGGLAGDARWASGPLVGSFWDIETTTQIASAGGIGMTTIEMQDSETYLSWAGCDNEGIWTIDDGKDYPRLSWESQTGEPIATINLPDLLNGTGTAEDPYLIHTAEQLNAIGLFPCEWDKCFRLVSDIDLSVLSQPAFNVIGSYAAPFNGIFEGSGYTVSNLTVHSPGRGFAGFFGYVCDPNAVISHLGLIDPDLATGSSGFVGSLVGYLEAGTLTGCYVEGCRVAGSYYAGGLVGQSKGTIADCHVGGDVTGTEKVGGMVGSSVGFLLQCSSTCTVSGHNDVGGLVGSIGQEGSERSRVVECYASGPVRGNENVGGLAGFSIGTISDCYANGPVDANESVGGLVGYRQKGTIVYCYAIGSVQANSWAGGLVGRNAGGSQGVLASFWDIETSGWTTGFAGTGKTTAEMQTAQTFRDVGWDFLGDSDDTTAAFWWIDEGRDYPRLRWELPEGDLSP